MQLGTAARPHCEGNQRVSGSAALLGHRDFMPRQERVGTGGGIIKGKLSVHSPLTGVDVKEAQRKGEIPSPEASKLYEFQSSKQVLKPTPPRQS